MNAPGGRALSAPTAQLKYQGENREMPKRGPSAPKTKDSTPLTIERPSYDRLVMMRWGPVTRRPHHPKDLRVGMA